MRQQNEAHTLQATALVNEVYVRLFGNGAGSWVDRMHFIHSASRAMRQVLVDHARRNGSERRGGGAKRAPMEVVFDQYIERSFDVLALEEALEKLGATDPTMAEAVDLRFFGGLSVGETARALGIPGRTFDRRWQMTRAWLYRQVR